VSVNIAPEASVVTTSVFTADQNGAPVPFTSGPYGGFVYPRADVAGQSGQGTPTGIVYFYDNGAQYSGPLNLNSEGNTEIPQGAFTFTAGQHALTATYSGDSSFKSATSAAVNFTITKATTGVTVSASPTGVAQGANVLLTANLSTPAFAGQTNVSSFPTGTVTFFNGSTQLGNGQVSGGELTNSGETGQATLNVSNLPTGQNSITAQYSGDSNFASSASGPTLVTVEADFSFSAGNSSVTVTSPGGSVTNNLTITGQSGYNGTVNFSAASCTGLPLLTTCSFSPASVSGNGSTTVTIKTTAATSASLRGFGLTSAGMMFAGVLLLNVPRRNWRLIIGLCLLLGFLALTAVGCGGGSGGGGGSGSPGTPTGSYNVVINATTTDGVLSHSANFTLVVQ
jgi:hypothetical protein